MDWQTWASLALVLVAISSVLSAVAEGNNSRVINELRARIAALEANTNSDREAK
jgi:hypothetical protein